jgi:NAD/NADP transhydrogenase alpha subunit
MLGDSGPSGFRIPGGFGKVRANMKLGIVTETRPEERRVAASPSTVAKWIKAGWEVAVERGAGAASSYPDSQYETAGATIVDRDVAWHADIVLKLRPPTLEEPAQLREGATLISYLFPAENPDLVEALAARKVTASRWTQVPRISRAQKMDALSSMANIAGYRAVIEAAIRFGSFFTGQITAAGKVPPAKVLIIGAGVAGLAALGAAKSLGAIVRAFDVRPAVARAGPVAGRRVPHRADPGVRRGQGGYAKEMSKEFIEAEMALFREQAKDVDIVITTALIPGKPAPKLWLADMVEADEARLGGRRSRGRAGRQLRADQARRGRSSTTASRSSATPIWPAAAQGGERAVRHQPVHFLDEMGGGRRVQGRPRERRGSPGARPRARRDKVAPPKPMKKVELAEGRGASQATSRRGGCTRTQEGPRSRRAASPPSKAVGRHHGGARVDRRRRVHRAGSSRRRSRCPEPPIVPPAPHGVRDGDLRRLAGHLERGARAAHAADERHQRDQRHHRRRRLAQRTQQRRPDTSPR